MSDLPKIPIARPAFDEAELRAVAAPLTDGWVVQGPRVRAFEERFGAFVDAPHSVATSSCTTALHLALLALDITAGDEVIVPALTWVATANVVEMCGARPIFCDVDPATWNLDVRLIPGLVTPRTKAIIAVHLFGLPADLAALEAAAPGVPIVEDAACGFGARIGNRHVGTFGVAGCFSFHPRKAITTGEGGMVTTRDPAIAARCRALRDHGATAPRVAGGPFLLPDFEEVGYNYRLTDIQAAIGLAQMDKAEWILRERHHRAAGYDAGLAGVPGLTTPVVPPGVTHGYQSYVCLYAPETPTLDNVEALNARRNALMTRLEAGGISTRQGTHAVTTLGVFRKKYGIRPEDYPGALFGDRLTLALPLYPQMTDEEQARVIDALKAEMGA